MSQLVEETSVKLVSHSNAAHADKAALTAALIAPHGVVGNATEVVSVPAHAHTASAWVANVSQPESTTHLVSIFITFWPQHSNAVPSAVCTAAIHA